MENPKVTPSRYSKNLHLFQNFQEFFQNFNIYFANFLLKMQHLTIRTIKKTFSRYSTIPCNQSFKNKFNFQKYYYGKIEKNEVFCNIFIKKKIWKLSVAENKKLLLPPN